MVDCKCKKTLTINKDDVHDFDVDYDVEFARQKIIHSIEFIYKCDAKDVLPNIFFRPLDELNDDELILLDNLIFMFNKGKDSLRLKYY